VNTDKIKQSIKQSADRTVQNANKQIDSLAKQVDEAENAPPKTFVGTIIEPVFGVEDDAQEATLRFDVVNEGPLNIHMNLSPVEANTLMAEEQMNDMRELKGRSVELTLDEAGQKYIAKLVRKPALFNLATDGTEVFEGDKVKVNDGTTAEPFEAQIKGLEEDDPTIVQLIRPDGVSSGGETYNVLQTTIIEKISGIGTTDKTTDDSLDPAIEEAVPEPELTATEDQPF